MVEYKNARCKVEIICPEHGAFKTTPHNHLHGRKCPKCKRSMNEINIEEYLLKKKIKYLYQKRFNDCKYKKVLPFDFYLSDYNLCIEYDGEQHFNSVSCWGGDKVFIENQIRDKIKDEYCKNKNIHLLRIKFDDNIYELIDNELIKLESFLTEII